MSKIKLNDRVKFIHDGREITGTLVGIVPPWEGPSISDFNGTHAIHFKLIYQGNRLESWRVESFLVSVEPGESGDLRQLYRPRRVELCELGDERVGLIQFNKGEKKWKP